MHTLQPSHNEIDRLQLKGNCLIHKGLHAVNWTAQYLSHGDIYSALHELNTLQEIVKHSKISIHHSCAGIHCIKLLFHM